MITTENFTIPTRYVYNLGWNAMYDISKKALIERGTIITHVDGNHEISMFETGEDINLLEFPEEVSAAPGSVYSDTEIGSCSLIDVKGFHLDRCRFPTQEELDWYNKLDTI